MIAWLALFQFLGNSTLGYIPSRSLLYWMFRAYHPVVPETTNKDEEPPETGDAHGMIVPFVVLALFWWKRKELLSAPIRTWSPAMLLVLTGLFFHVLGYAVQQPRVSIVGLFTGIYGLMGLAWGPIWLARAFFPYCLFVFAVPLGSLADSITFQLRLLVSKWVEFIAHNLLLINVIRSGTKLVDPSGNYEYEVAAACSGMRSLVATIGMGVILGFVSFRSWWKRGLMLASAFPLAVLGNLVRMLLIVVASDFGGRSWGKYVHDGGPAGLLSLLPYVPAFIGLLMLEGYLKRGEKRRAAVKPVPRVAAAQAPISEAIEEPVQEVGR